uniref:Immunoglobulin domain-containing protein n=1 Tax=Lates calcarifer TaxID=8187 RepID=A0A4W6F9T8_LATCA
FQWKALTYLQTAQMRTGEDVTVQCFFTSFGISKFFCKDSCQEKVLVGTAGDRAQRDRYSIRYLTGTRGGSFLFVTITNLTKSDSGQYWCALDSSSLRDFELIVTDGENKMPLCSHPSLLLALTNRTETAAAVFPDL